MKILIIEDEPQTAEILAEIIQEVNSEATIVGILESIDQSVKFLSNKKNNPDLIFSDIQLADGLSFEIFKQVQIQCPVIFCTAFDQYTLEAFKTNGIEYILKPIKEEDVSNAFAKYNTLKNWLKPDEDIAELIKQSFSAKQKYKTSILVQYKESYIPVEIQNIAVFLVDTEIVYAHTFDHQRYAVHKTMAEIENDLDPAMFYRISRQALLNRKAIKEIQPYFHRKVVVKTALNISEQLIVSRLKVTEFMNWVEQPS
jgi:two-component system response regulator LytT